MPVAYGEYHQLLLLCYAKGILNRLQDLLEAIQAEKSISLNLRCSGEDSQRKH